MKGTPFYTEGYREGTDVAQRGTEVVLGHGTGTPWSMLCYSSGYKGTQRDA